MIDLAILAAFVVYALAMGLRARRQASRDFEQYFLAGRSVPGWQAGMSMAATQFAADTPLLVMGLIATGGVFLLWQLWVYGVAFLLMGFVFSATWRRAGILTDAELTEIRYSERGSLALRAIKALYYGTVINCVVMAFVLVAAVRIAEVFLPWHLWLPDGLYMPLHDRIAAWGLALAAGGSGLDATTATTNNVITILALLAFTAGYSTTGGLRSVIATDVVQFLLALLATGAYAWIIVHRIGGLDAMGEQLVALYGPARAERFLSLAPGKDALLLPFLTILSLQWLFQMNSDGTGYLAQRSMACRSDRDARTAAILFTWMQIVVRSLIWVVIGIGLLVIFPFTPGAAEGDSLRAAREMTFVDGISTLPPGIRGLMLTGMLAALASTLDTHLNWGASYWSNDIYKRLINQAWRKREPKPRELVLVARLANLLVIVLALAVMSRLGSIQEGWKLSLLFGAGVGSVLVLRWLWERINLYSEAGAMLVSFVAGLVLLHYFPDNSQEWMRLAIMAAVSTCVAIGITFVTPQTEPERLHTFYRRVRPMGFWARTARAVGDDPAEPLHRLKHRLILLLVTAAAVFATLVGAARLLLHGPGYEPLWGGALLAVGIALGIFSVRGLEHEENLAPLPHPASFAGLTGESIDLGVKSASDAK